MYAVTVAASSAVEKVLSLRQRESKLGCVCYYALMDDAGWYRMHCHLQLHWIFFYKSKISAAILLLAKMYSLSLQGLGHIAVILQCQNMKYTEELSL